MMQHHENTPQGDGEHASEKERQAGEIFAFQEVVYPPRPEMNRWLQYFIGIGIGAIPLAALLLSANSPQNVVMSSILMPIALYGFIFVIIGMIVCFCVPRIRFVGYGLLTMVLVAPVVFFIACVVSMQHSCGYRGSGCR